MNRIEIRVHTVTASALMLMLTAAAYGLRPGIPPAAAPEAPPTESVLRLDLNCISLQPPATPPPAAEPEPVPEPAAEAEPALPPEPQIEPDPEPPAIEPKPMPEPVDRAVDETPAEPIEEAAPIIQQAAAKQTAADMDRLRRWLFESIEHAKYYPRSARSAGLEGGCRIEVRISADGVIRDFSVLKLQGRPVFRTAAKKTMQRLIGRHYDQALAAETVFQFELTFKLN